MKVRSVLAVVLLASLCSAGFAGNRYAASFLRIGADARTDALGGVGVVIQGGPAAFQWNPAALSRISSPVVQGMYATQFGGFRTSLAVFHHLGVAFPLRGNAVLALNWIHFGVDDIPVYAKLRGNSIYDRLKNPAYRPSGTALGTLQDSENALFFTFTRRLHYLFDPGWLYLKVPLEIPVGVNFKILRTVLGKEQASGLGIDLGGQIRFSLTDLFPSLPLGTMAIGFAVKDLTGTQISWTTRHQEMLDPAVLWGMAYEQSIPVWKSRVSIFSANSEYRGNLSRFGAEWAYLGKLWLRIGYGERQLAMGVGLAFSRFQVDYALETHELGPSHRISLRLNLKKEKNP